MSSPQGIGFMVAVERISSLEDQQRLKCTVVLLAYFQYIQTNFGVCAGRLFSLAVCLHLFTKVFRVSGSPMFGQNDCSL